MVFQDIEDAADDPNVPAAEVTEVKLVALLRVFSSVVKGLGSLEDEFAVQVRHRWRTLPTLEVNYLLIARCG